MPIFGNMMYSSWGPVCDIHDKKVLEQLTDGIKELGKKYNYDLVLKPQFLNTENYKDAIGYEIVMVRLEEIAL